MAWITPIFFWSKRNMPALKTSSSMNGPTTTSTKMPNPSCAIALNVFASSGLSSMCKGAISHCSPSDATTKQPAKCKTRT